MSLHTRTVLSTEEVTMRVLSGLNSAEETQSSWPRRTSADAVTIPVPFGLNAAEWCSLTLGMGQ
ncbi:MAG: hypothetical protein MJE77_40390 [Proteobacteria bacterium]|nr:hypothetical protein [Pseudomonadota bacterium]